MKKINSTEHIKITQKPKISNDMTSLIHKKVHFFQDVIQKTFLYVHKNKTLDILGISDVNNCINTLFLLNKQLKDLLLSLENSSDVASDYIINELQNINNELSILFKSYGTDSLDDLLSICFGNNTVDMKTISETDILKLELLKKYVHPISYKIIVPKKENKLTDGSLNENSKNLDCINIPNFTKSFHLKVHGVQIVIHHTSQNKSLIINGVVDDISVDILNNSFINHKLRELFVNLPKEEEFNNEGFTRFISCLSLKDFLIYNSNDFYSKYIGYYTNIKTLKCKNISQTLKEFLANDLYLKRILIIQLLIFNSSLENQYLAYLLYDILSNDVNGNVDTQEQIIMFDSFPWLVKQYFKEAMQKTIQYTNELTNFDVNKIPTEQQICLMKVNDGVKEKAMQKVKELKSKPEDSGSKARQYLDGLLKIPFGIFRKEPVLYIMDNIKQDFATLVKTNNIPDVEQKDNYTSIEIAGNLTKIKQLHNKTNILSIKHNLMKGDKSQLLDTIHKIEFLIGKHSLSFKTIAVHKKESYKQYISDFIDFVKDELNILLELSPSGDKVLNNRICQIENNYKHIHDYMENIKTTLDDAVYGNIKAKNQISRIIAQWINGEQDGYCFGFEGPPGVGKTTLAKRGLSNCLKDDKGESRPFSMIQIGGDSNGSSLHGHNYTYVGSTWGSIAQILMDKKCMNPIIFIDEVDKISKTEHGKEIVGILTHLLDPSQNDCFQDKYFSGIDLDLSKALFILSYNDPELIDRILLDRIHRIKFTNLTLEDKLVICNKHILPEIYKKMGLDNMVIISDDVLKVIIDEYTCESGVRKLKEVLFEIVGEINLDYLYNFDKNLGYPIHVSVSDIKTKYFKDKHEVTNKRIYHCSRVGFINGMWANAMGQGGIIPIQCNFFPSNEFLKLKLTGMQGDVMKESMNVALTMAWNLTPTDRKDTLFETHKSKLNGIHIHCPEGAVPKDGPSAGAAITTAIYSLFNDMKIKHDYAITGEISLDGTITEIGGLDLKFLGGIKAGVKHFIYPKDNEKDYKTFVEKYKDNPILDGVDFVSVYKIEEVFNIIFE